ncbi:hypothetical protein MGSAQ_003330, partial [marine sediment metagenome]
GALGHKHWGARLARHRLEKMGSTPNPTGPQW